MENFNSLGGMITNDARYTRKIKSTIFMAKSSIQKAKTFSPGNWS